MNTAATGGEARLGTAGTIAPQATAFSEATAPLDAADGPLERKPPA
jgi:hypothetical protein